MTLDRCLPFLPRLGAGYRADESQAAAESERQRLSKLESDKAALERMLQQEREGRAKAEHRVEVLERDVSSKSALHLGAERQLQDARSRLEVTEAELAAAREEHRRELAAAREERQREVAAAREELRQELAAVRGDAKKDLLAARADQRDLAEEVSQMSAKLLACGERIHTQQRRIQQLEQERGVLEAKLTEAATTRDLFSREGRALPLAATACAH